MRSDSSSASQRFVAAYLGWALLPVVLAAVMNLLVDPIHLLPFDGIAGLNANKSQLRDQERLFKPFAVQRLRPAALILGTSRSNYALDPLHPAWRGQRSYNFSVSGTNIEETRRLFEHAIATADVHQIIIELDLGLFATSDAQQRQAASYLATRDNAHRLGQWRTVLSTAIAWHTFKLSLATLRGQHEPPEYTPLGQQTERVFRQRIASYGGVRNTFEGYMQRLAPNNHAQAQQWARAGLSGERLPGMDDLIAMINTAAQRHIELRLYISPSHAMDQELVRHVYGWQQLEAWKRALVRAVANAAGNSQSPADVQLWDFSGYNSITTETVPAAGDGTAYMQYFWDQSHYTQRVGDWVLDRIYGISVDGRMPPEDFGIRLTADNMQAWFSTTRTAADNYALSHPHEAAFIQQLTDTAP